MIPSNKSIDKRLLIHLFVFSIAMALLESAVVVYLRALYYPEGFTVAMKLIDTKIVWTELLRELATVVMLSYIAIIAGRSRLERFAYFLFCFAIWDIFYYAWLKMLIDWPSSLFEWDILFLIPITWLGPVLAPLICSFTMIFLSLAILINKKEGVKKSEWVLLFVGSAIILFTFLFDYGKIMFANNLWSEYSTLLSNPAFISATSNYIPQSYLWELFLLGELFLLSAITLIYRRNSSPQQPILSSKI